MLKYASCHGVNILDSSSQKILMIMEVSEQNYGILNC
jgi:hypothetical protein